MEWERAKNIILIAFVVLNLGLAGLFFAEYRRYTLSPARINTVVTVLSANNINLDTSLPRRFEPMRHLDISGFYYDLPALLAIFFDEPENLYHIEDDHGVIFSNGVSTLDISNGFVTFENGEPAYSPYEISRDDAILIAQNFINLHFPNFVPDMILDAYSGDGVQIIFREQYRGQIILSNYIEFLISRRRVEWIEMQFGRVIGHSAEARMIFAPDEILLTFLQRMRHSAMENPIFISSIDMVYLLEYASYSEGQVYPAVPFYRIFIRYNDFEFLINAYTNVPGNF